VNVGGTAFVGVLLGVMLGVNDIEILIDGVIDAVGVIVLVGVGDGIVVQSITSLIYPLEDILTAHVPTPIFLTK
jgi:NaMN:DMB phosphoribosyltransferase